MRRGILDDCRLAPALSRLVPGLERAFHLSGTQSGRPAGVVGLPRPILPRSGPCLGRHVHHLGTLENSFPHSTASGAIRLFPCLAWVRIIPNKDVIARQFTLLEPLNGKSEQV